MRKIILSFCLLLFVGTATTVQPVQALSFGGIVNGISAAVNTASSFINAFRGGSSGGSGLAFGGGGGGGGPNVPNGGILAGPGSAAAGVTHVRDGMIPQLTNWVAAFLLAASVAVVIVGGLMYIFAGGDQEMYDKARNTIIWAILGVIMVILSYTAVQIVINLNYLS